MANTAGLSTLDLSEIARNSVLQSGFTHEEKKLWLGDRYASTVVTGLPNCGGDDSETGTGTTEGRPPRLPEPVTHALSVGGYVWPTPEASDTRSKWGRVTYMANTKSQ